MNRRRLLTALTAAAFAPGLAQAAGTPIKIYKTSSCGCCQGWIDHMAKSGFSPQVVVLEDVSPLWRRRGIRGELSSCHVADIGGYTVIGHVPAADVRRLLKEKPKAIGLTVPGMPWGSPGMEGPKGEKEAYESLLILEGGRTRIFGRHGKA